MIPPMIKIGIKTPKILAIRIHFCLRVGNPPCPAPSNKISATEMTIIISIIFSQREEFPQSSPAFVSFPGDWELIIQRGEDVNHSNPPTLRDGIMGK